MDRYQKDVNKLHENGVFKPTPPQHPTLEGYNFELHIRLIMEEALEFIHACGYAYDRLCPEYKNDPPFSLLYVKNRGPDMAKMIDAIVDILYVTYGAATVMGIDLDPFWNAVQKANATKGDGPIDEHGKRLKPEGWQPPDIEGILAQVMARKLPGYFCLACGGKPQMNEGKLCNNCWCEGRSIRARDNAVMVDYDYGKRYGFALLEATEEELAQWRKEREDREVSK